MAIDSKGNIWVSEHGNNRVQEFSTEGKSLAHFGTAGTGAGQLKTPYGIAIDGSGNIWVAEQGNNRGEEFSASGTFITQFGWKGTGAGQLIEPRGLAIDAKGNVWMVDTGNNRLEEWSKGPNAHDEKTVDYGAEPNTEGYSNCGKHAEWAGLPCEMLPAKQPELASLPKLPVTTLTYNMWFEPETTTETFAGATRTKKESYEEGRLTKSETTATGTENKALALPPVSFEYNKETGVLDKQSTTVEGKEKAIATEANRLGQLVKYTDASGNVATYKWAGPEADGLLEEVSDSHLEVKEGKEVKSDQRYSYEETTKAMIKLEDSAAGTFTASYDSELNMTSEIFPQRHVRQVHTQPSGRNDKRCVRQDDELHGDGTRAVQRHANRLYPRRHTQPDEHTRQRELQLRRRRTTNRSAGNPRWRKLHHPRIHV